MPDAEHPPRHLAPDTYHLLLQLPQHLKQLFVVRLIGNVVNVYVGELAFLIDDEYRALRNAVARAIRAEGLSYFAFGMKVAEKIVGKSAETFCPGGVARDAVD